MLYWNIKCTVESGRIVGEHVPTDQTVAKTIEELESIYSQNRQSVYIHVLPQNITELLAGQPS